MVRTPRILLYLHLTLLCLLCLPTHGHADDLRLLGDWTFSRYSAQIDNDRTNEQEDNQSRRFNQLYRLDVNKELFPTLNLNVAAQLEKNDLRNTSDGEKTDFTDTTVRPFLELELHTSLITFTNNYEDRRSTTEVTGIETSHDYSKTYTSRFEWRPTDLPTLELNYVKNSRYDDPLTRDADSRTYRLTSKYDYEDFDFLYNFLRSDESEKVRDTETRTTTHNGRIRYFSNFLENKLAVNASVRMERTTLEFSGSGPRTIRTFPTGNGFFLLNDLTPETNIQGEFTDVSASNPFSSVNLGSGGSLNQVSLGLSFGDATRVDQLRVLIQADQPTLNQLSNSSFSWRVFVSDDQQNWTETGISSVIYNQLDSRFEINLSSEPKTEYIKLVTTPLSDPSIGSILVAGLEAYVTLGADQDRIVSNYRNATMGLAYDISDKTKVIYDTNYQYRETDLFDERRTRWSNGVNLIHRFNPVFTGNTRFLQTDTWEQGKHDTSSYNYSAQLVGRYLETLSQSLTYSGGQSKEPEGDSSFNSIILRTNAELYRGWDVAFDQGYTWQSPVEGGDTSSFFFRIQNSITPHPRFNLIADYSMRWTQEESQPDSISRNSGRSTTGRFRALWTPTDNLSLTGEVRIRNTDDDSYTYWQYSANWLPFRDGTLQFNLNYAEEGDTDDDMTRTLSPSLVWNITRSSALTLLYTKGKQVEGDETTDYDNYQINFRIYYD